MKSILIPLENEDAQAIMDTLPATIDAAVAMIDTSNMNVRARISIMGHQGI